ncbi:vegetatible incompatibility HET-E-1 [Fusarium albosuccineum]|uniref:Vegetatible incompatibility HET-E-1 n=1 Tax=Fusarium albosuccineum TaxID=1237068 RepID=A0A8H4L488_9HYPO|nr:vegetatible incompatibility HET-E-1 [Fusarium albosuccineum]
MCGGEKRSERWMRDFIAASKLASRLVVKKTIPEKYSSSLRKTATRALRVPSLEVSRASRKTSASSSRTIACQIVEGSLQTAPFGVAIAFSGVRIVLECAVRVQGVLSEVFDALEEIAPDLKCYELIASAQQDSADISQAIKQAYAHILEFWCLSVGILSRSYKRIAVSSLLKSLKPIIEAFRGKIRQDSIKVQHLLAARRAAQELSLQQKQLRREIAEWIRGSKDGSNLSDQEVDLRAKRQRRTQNTCTWMFEDDKFRVWRDTKHNSVLWYNAPPGTGKSIMASAVIDHLQTLPGSEVAYFFYSFSETSKQHGFGGFRSLALQLLGQLKFTPDALKQEYAQAVQQLKYSLDNTDCDTIKKVLHTLLDQSPQVFIVLDGLDECMGEEADFFRTLEDLLQSRTNGTAKWFFSSCDISSMRHTMSQIGAQEIRPDFAAVSKDIHTYLKAQDISLRPDTDWIDLDEQNFLYARLRCEIVKGRGYTTRQEISEALRGRVFRLLIAAEKPLSVDELLDALAIDPNAKDHSPTRGPMGGYSMVEDVCNPLIATESTKSFQVVKFYHKSVRDFFVQTSDKDIDKRLGDFLVDQNEAGVELGRACLTYLNYERYTKPLDLKALVSKTSVSTDHAFLRYAATFWHMHLWNTKHPSPQVIRAVEEFLTSPAYWTCVYVQSHVARHLFARYNKKSGTSAYSPTMGRMTNSSGLFAVPLPQWMVTCSSTSTASLDRSLCAFVQDWGELLTKNPDHLDKAVPLTLFQPGCHLTAPGKHPKVRVKYSSKVLGQMPGLLLVDSCFPANKSKGGKTLQLRIIREEGEKPDRQVRVYKVAVFPKPKVLSESEHHLSSETLKDGWVNTLVRGNELGEDLIQAWKVNPQNLNLRREFQSQSLDYTAPKALKSELGLDEQEGGFWRRVQLTLVTEPGRGDTDPTTRLFHLRWVPQKHPDNDSDLNGTRVSDPQASSDSDSDTDSDSDSDSDFDSDSDSDSESNSCSGSDETTRDSSDETEISDLHGDLDQSSHEPHQDCLIVVSDFGVPAWRSIRTNHSLWSKLTGARHPTLPIVALSYKSGQVDIINDMTGSSTSVEVIEQGDMEASKVAASSRELQFSPCGNYLHLLSITFGSVGFHTECRVTMSTYKFTHHSPSTYSFQAHSNGPSADFGYRSAEILLELPEPFVLTCWTPESVVVALPPLTYNPKIVKISLAVSGDQGAPLPLSAAVSTLSSPIFFPASAISRNSHLMYCNGNTGEEDSYLYLVLDTSMTTCENPQTTPLCGPGQVLSTEDFKRPVGEKGAVISPPVVLRWKVAGINKPVEKDADDDEEGGPSEKQTWREWNGEEDGVSEDIKAGRSAADEWRMLRGDFVVGRKYWVSYRCGLDWTRQGFLSCS